MEFLNRALSQANDLFRSMTPGTRITIGLLVIVIVISLTFLFQGGFEGEGKYLMGGQAFSSSELTAMEAAFAKAGLTGWTIDGNRIQVPPGQESAYMGALADAGALPPDFHDILNKTLNEPSPFIAPKLREEMIKNAKQEELALYIRNMPGIEKAAVQYDMRQQGGLSRKTVSTASAIVKPTIGARLDSRQVRMIRHLVSAAFAELSPEDVTVTDLNGAVYVGTGDEDLGSGEDHQYIAAMKTYQHLIENNVYKALSHVPGVTVSVNAELNPELERSYESLHYDDKNRGTLATREESSESDSQSNAPGGRPGLAAQGGLNTGDQLARTERTTHNTSSTSMREDASVPGQELTKSRSIGLLPKRVTVAVGVPTSYFSELWHSRNPTPAGEEPKQPTPDELKAIEQEEVQKIRNHVAPLIPAPADPAQVVAHVTVTPFDSVASDTITGPSTVDKAVSWFGRSWSTLATIGLALASLLVLRSIIKSVPEPEPIPDIIPLSQNEEDDEEQDSPDGGPRLRRDPAAEHSLRDDLAALVREDPDAAAQILRGWIGKAS